jgi:hypothetical protein
MTLESEVWDFIHDVAERAERGAADQREIAQALELKASIEEYYEEIQTAIHEKRIDFTESVVVRCNGQTIKFPNIEGVAQWIINLK